MQRKKIKNIPNENNKNFAKKKTLRIKIIKNLSNNIIKTLQIQTVINLANKNNKNLVNKSYNKPCKCWHLSSARNFPTTWTRRFSSRCWRVLLWRQWTSPNPCPCASLPCRTAPLAPRSAEAPLKINSPQSKVRELVSWW